MKKSLVILALLGAVISGIAPWAYLTATGIDGFSTDPGYALLIWGRLVGIIAMLGFLWQLLSMGRKRTTDALGKALVIKSHRKLGLATLILVLLHIGMIVAGRAISYDQTIGEVITDFVCDQSWGTVTTLGMAILATVWVTSWLFVAKRLTYKPFSHIHKLAYLGILLIFGHQIMMGIDFVNSPAYIALWSTLLALPILDTIWCKLKA